MAFYASLREKVSEGTKILTDQHDQNFQIPLERWSMIDHQVPSAVLQPVSEADTVVIVSSRYQLAHFPR